MRTIKELNEQFEKVTTYFKHGLDYDKFVKGSYIRYSDKNTEHEWKAYYLCALTNNMIIKGDIIET